MNATKATLSKALLLVVPMGAAIAFGAAREAQAQYAPPPPMPPQQQYVAPPGAYVAPPAPPPAFVATSVPEYYEGHPVYLYNGSWYFRDAHGGWNYYHNEPQYLHDRRTVHEHEAPRDQHRYEYHR
jgi:hypothetical protein